MRFTTQWQAAFRVKSLKAAVIRWGWLGGEGGGGGGRRFEVAGGRATSQRWSRLGGGGGGGGGGLLVELRSGVHMFTDWAVIYTIFFRRSQGLRPLELCRDQVNDTAAELVTLLLANKVSSVQCWRKEEANIPPSKVKNDLCSTRQILAQFQG